MRILHVVPSYFPAVRYGGPIWSVHGLAAGEAALGHEVHVFTTNADGPGVSDVPLDRPAVLDGVKVHYFAVGSPRRLFRAPAMARALAERAGEFDVVHLHSVFLWPTLAAARAARRAGVPYVLSPRGMLVKGLIAAKSGPVKRAWLALFERRTIAGAAALHVTSQQEASDFAGMGFTARAIVEIPNGVDPPSAAMDRPATDVAAEIAKGPYVLYLGRLNWKKNLQALIDAMAEVPSLRLVIAGNDEAYAATLDGAALGDRLSLIARSVDGADKEALFTGASIFCLPSTNENFGNTVLEAMARGVPVVCSKHAGAATVVRETQSGLLAMPEALSLGAALAQLVRQPDRAAACARAGRRAAAEQYGWKPIAERMVAAYRAIRSTNA
ncbi:glycosyltransferase [Sphingomonas sp.]|uniref:glycosyltransferase n=1 Tax=Sphingomonas sp. TaxID=28214 RepID=UPI001B0197E6|nr:glycosyltransferase [Sphingomonas sp.]MBO9711490.1 glycosyltransferase [Sphingomonas sp.]